MTTGDFETYYIDEGSGEPLILLHGGGAGADSFSNWRECLPLFSKCRRVIAVDMVGFGHTDKPDPANFTYSQDARNSQVIALIEALGLERVSIVGNSMGGATALGVTARRPDLVENLVLMGSAGIPGMSSAALEPIMNYDFTLDGMRRIVVALTNSDYVIDEEQVQYRYELTQEPDIRAAYTAIMGWVRENEFGYSLDEIEKVETRTLVVHGKEDKVVPLASAYEFLKLLKNSSGYLIPHCGHWVMNEYPDVFARVTLDFLDAYGVNGR
ncbi:alpha/beta fold hydrolase [Mycobacterium lentiflavum]|uniref:alpha/beta fold hydrolase n=1 Tax=Mycobacterium lentiflavum TaxID=141349 RepID=UPI001C306BAF|nr:alpha/beta hydrolase [Mycobacterium lentiflavum]